jgi:hypothetical protein
MHHLVVEIGSGNAARPCDILDTPLVSLVQEGLRIRVPALWSSTQTIGKLAETRGNVRCCVTQISSGEPRQIKLHLSAFGNGNLSFETDK